MKIDALKAYRDTLRHPVDLDQLVNLRLAAEDELDQVNDLEVRTILAWHYVTGATMKEVAMMFNCTVRAIYQKLRKE